MPGTISSSSPVPGAPGDIIVKLLDHVALGNGDVIPTNWPAVERALAALPLMTANYGLCRLRVANARKYLEAEICEPHAAAVEARLLLGSLARLGFVSVKLSWAKSKDH